MRRRITAFVAVLALFGSLAGTANAENVLASGTISARFTGQPVGEACVTVFDSSNVEVAHTCADQAGRYRVESTAPTGQDYKVKVSAAGYADTWNSDNGGDARGIATAKTAHLSGGQLDLGLRPTGEGVVRGVVTADMPGFRARVRVHDADYPQQIWNSVGVAADGTYRVDGLWPARYRVEILTEALGNQWYHQKDTPEEAEVVTVPAGVEPVVDEQIFPRGVVDLSVVDEVTGAPVNEFCVFVPGRRDRSCTTTGQVDHKLVRGTYGLAVTVTQKTHFSPDTVRVTVRPGEVTKVTVKAKPAVAIQTTIRDAKTGDPVAGACTQPVADRGVSDSGVRSWCSDQTGAVTIGPLAPAVYNLFVRPGDTTHGMQWVGRLGGGTGIQELAREIDGKPGTYTKVPPIRLDPAGTISGIVKDKQTGDPFGGVKVFPYATTSSDNSGAATTDAQGAYTVTGLGPYWWPLEFTSSAGKHAWQWSGNAADRFHAAKVKVNSGHNTAAAVETLSAGGSLSGVTSVEGQETSSVEVTVVNAWTGDVAGPVVTDSGRGYTIDGLATQQVKVHFREVTFQPVWYKDAASFDSATPVRIIAGHTTGGIDQHVK
ncbi:carboxypeptidase-like regulatory domain-containing protein [Kibdelosporangium philippinense]|uniref:Carboxypeptidase-like regulatory domain-containing protein n=1 Tax=Kibdelosporangium philippinense TaxID=211113 RepID=A0ABS8ZL75_9PSEU|nr:carboxypeptidase-like regulatory domain-containing protein [Kibdelosporangium philippinense]MCE7008534.1 carboxypeptidase-like regulatory domain-containing protein [Kibdelosporangium philippinense]